MPADLNSSIHVTAIFFFFLGGGGFGWGIAQLFAGYFKRGNFFFGFNLILTLVLLKYYLRCFGGRFGISRKE